MPPRRVSAVTSAAVLVLAGIAAAVPSRADAPLVPPSHDAFYRYDGKVPLSRIAPGTPLKSRSVTLGASTYGTPLEAEQLQYRTTDATGHAVMSVTTYVLPATGVAAPRVMAYLSFYDALGSQCNPSYTLRGGDPGANNQKNAGVEQAVVQTLHQQGYVVTVPDFEDQTLDYVAGTESGMSALDGIRATLAVLRIPSAPVGLVGYSGGSIAADWAAELAPRYAPKLDLVGVAMGGIPVNLLHNMRYIDGSPSWASVIPAALIGISRSFHQSLMPYLSAYGRKVVAEESGGCIGDWSYPGLTFAKLMKPQYSDPTRVPVFQRILNQLAMGQHRPRTPFLIADGNLDGTGDGVMIAADQKALAGTYCKDGLPVVYAELPRLEHTQAGAAFFAMAVPYLAERFTPAPAPSTCGLSVP